MAAIRTYALFFGLVAVWAVVAGWSLTILARMPFPDGQPQAPAIVDAGSPDPAQEVAALPLRPEATRHP